MTQQTNGETNPKQVFSHSIQFAGVPQETLLSSIALLLNVYGIIHTVPYNPEFDTSGLTSGNAQADARFHNDYMNFKMMLDGLVHQFDRVECKCQSNGVVIRMTFTCY